MRTLLDDVIPSILPTEAQIKGRIEKSSNEVDLVIQKQNDVKVVKILNISGIKDTDVLYLHETISFQSVCCSTSIYPFIMHQMNNDSEHIIISREYYDVDIEGIILYKSLSRSDICHIIYSLCETLMILSKYGIVVSNLKSSNIIYEDANNIKMCDLFLNILRKNEEMRVYDVCFKSPEELIGLKCNEKSVVWSIGCILYEMILKKLPFNEDDDMSETKENILKCKYSFNVKCDDEMKEMIERMLKVRNENRLSLKELKKEMTKMSEMLRDDEDSLIICKERKEILLNNDNTIVKFPIIYPSKYYVENKKWIEIRDSLIESYNNKPNERLLSILLMMKLYKKDCYDHVIKDRLKFQIHHQCKEGRECCLDEMIFNIFFDMRIIKIFSYCFCSCEEGTNYLFRILKLISPSNLKFDNVRIPIQCQSLFGRCFSQLSNLQLLDLSYCNFTSDFVECFIKSIAFMKLKYVNLEYNPIGPKGFKLLLPYLHLLINKDNEMNLEGMNLNDQSMVLLSEKLCKYPYLKRINIKYNKRIHTNRIKILLSKFSSLCFNVNKRYLIDKEIPRFIHYIIYKYVLEYDCYCDAYYGYGADLSNLNIDDNIFKSFISLRSNELRVVSKLDLRYNKLTFKSIKMLINKAYSFRYLRQLHLNGNEIGDEGMQILSSYLHLIQDCNSINCSEMGLSSEGLKYIVDNLNNINYNYYDICGYEEVFFLFINDNHIDSEGIEYLMNYVKQSNHMWRISIHNNPIGNSGFRLLMHYLYMLVNEVSEIDLSDISIDDESVILLTNALDSIREYDRINLKGNNIRMNGLKTICSKSIEKEEYPFTEMKCFLWTNEELEYYLNYCIKKNRKDYREEYDLSNVNINDSHILKIKQIHYWRLDLCDNKITSKGLKELTDHLPRYSQYISIHSNPIGDDGIETISRNLDIFVEKDERNTLISLNLSNIGMTKKGLKMLIERLKNYDLIHNLDISGNELDQDELKIMLQNREMLKQLYELAITINQSIERMKIKSFLETFIPIGVIKLTGISEEEKEELSKEFFNIE